MGIVKKGFAAVMIILGGLIILEETNTYSMNLTYPIALIGSALMIIFQIIHLFSGKIHNGHMGIMPIITSFVFIFPAVGCIADYLGLISIPSIQLIIGVMLFIESLYALH